MNYSLGSILNTQTSNGDPEKDVVSRRMEEAGPQSGHIPRCDTFQPGPAPQYWCQRRGPAEMAGHSGCAHPHPAVFIGSPRHSPGLAVPTSSGTLAWSPFLGQPFSLCFMRQCVLPIWTFYERLLKLRFMVPSLGSPVNSPTPSYPPPILPLSAIRTGTIPN